MLQVLHFVTDFNPRSLLHLLLSRLLPQAISGP